MVILKTGIMNKLLFIFCMITLLSCGSKKKFNKIDSVENSKSTEQFYAELYRESRLLEFLGIKYRKVETRDSSGNVRIETEAEISKKSKENKQDTIKVIASRQKNDKKVMNQESENERSGVVKYWTWIIGFVVVTITTLVIGIFVLKRH